MWKSITAPDLDGFTSQISKGLKMHLQFKGRESKCITSIWDDADTDSPKRINHYYQWQERNNGTMWEGEVNVIKPAGLTDIAFKFLLPNSDYPFNESLVFKSKKGTTSMNSKSLKLQRRSSNLS